jgi:hypothetical protein
LAQEVQLENRRLEKHPQRPVESQPVEAGKKTGDVLAKFVNEGAGDAGRSDHRGLFHTLSPYHQPSAFLHLWLRLRRAVFL